MDALGDAECSKTPGRSDGHTRRRSWIGRASIIGGYKVGKGCGRIRQRQREGSAPPAKDLPFVDNFVALDHIIEVKVGRRQAGVVLENPNLISHLILSFQI